MMKKFIIGMSSLVSLALIILLVLYSGGPQVVGASRGYLGISLELGSSQTSEPTVISEPQVAAEPELGEVVEKRTANSKTFYLGDGQYELLITGPLHYQDEVGDWQQINNSIIDGVMSEDIYTLQLLQPTFDAGQIVEVSYNGSYVRFQPMELQWTCDSKGIQSISMPQEVIGSVTNVESPLVEPGDGYSRGEVVWTDAYGSGRHFEWVATPHKLLKLLTINDALPEPEQYILDGGNPVLRLSFIFDPSAELDIVVDGEVWDKKTEESSFNAIQFHKEGELLWQFDPALYWASDEEQHKGTTVLRKVGNKLWVDVLVPYSWILDAEYPIYIDPPLTIQPGSEGEDNYLRNYAPTTNYGSGTNVQAGYFWNIFEEFEEVMRSILEFTVDWNDLDGRPIDSAVLSLYCYTYQGSSDTYYASRMKRLDWVEDESTWNIYKTGSNWGTAGCGSTSTDYTTTNQVSISTSGTGWKAWTITDQADWAYTNTENVAVRVVGSTTSGTTSKYMLIRSSDYTSDTSLRPKLVINYRTLPTTTILPATLLTGDEARINAEVLSDGGAACEGRFGWAEIEQDDDFEWGSDGDPLTDRGGGIYWSTVAADPSKVEIEDAGGVPYAGTRCAKLHRDGASAVRAHFPQTAGEDYNIRFRFQKDATSWGYAIHGNGAKRIILVFDSSENIRYLDEDGDWIDTGYNVIVGTWYLFEVKDIDWTAGTFDLYFDRDLIADDAEMQTSSSYNNVISFNNASGTSDIYIDNVLVTKTWTLTAWDGGSHVTDDPFYSDLTSLSTGTRHVYEAQLKNIIDEGLWSAEATFVTIGDPTVTPVSLDFGSVAESSTYWANTTEPSWPLADGACYFTVTNTGGPADIKIKATNFVGGDGWTLVSGSPGSGEVRLSVFESGDGSGDGVALTTGEQAFISNMETDTSTKWELKLETGTFTDGVVKATTVTLIAVTP